MPRLKTVGTENTDVENKEAKIPVLVYQSDEIYKQCEGVIPRKNPEDYVSTGITLLNLALSNNKDAGFQLGQIVEVDGVPHGGKTFFAQNFLANACYSSFYKSYIKKFVDAEKADDFDKLSLYGEEYENQVSDIYEYEESPTLESFYDKAVDICENSKVPVLMTLDSHTSLIAELEKNLFDENAKLREDEKKLKSDYTSMKIGQVNSSGLRRLNCALVKSKSIVVFLTQMRSNVDGGLYAPKFKATTGGNALPHYAQYRIQMNPKEKIEVLDFKKQEQLIGYHTEIKILKNKGTGKQCIIEVPVYKEYGIDDLGANLNYLRTYDIIKGVKVTSLNSPFNPKDENDVPILMSLKELTKYIEDNNLEEKVKEEVEKTWLKAELSVSLGRKKKFGC